LNKICFFKKKKKRKEKENVYHYNQSDQHHLARNTIYNSVSVSLPANVLYLDWIEI